MKRKDLIVILIIFAAIILLIGVGIYAARYYNSPNVILPGGNVPGTTACTQEAKLCPDGSYVGRTGPDCSFAPCPSPTPVPINKSCSGPGDTSCPAGYECIQQCGPPVVREGDIPPPYYCEVIGKPRICPICLAADTRIATLEGEVKVQDVTVGMQAWSVNAAGERVVSKVIQISKQPVPKSHKVTHLVLADGREVLVSPNHPAADGRTIGYLKVGEAYDDSIIQSVTLEPYTGGFTYDLLPDSATGSYFANGILLGSTLFKH